MNKKQRLELLSEFDRNGFILNDETFVNLFMDLSDYLQDRITIKDEIIELLILLNDEKRITKNQVTRLEFVLTSILQPLC